MQRRLKETQAAAGGVGTASQAVASEVKKIESTLTSRAPVRFLAIDVASEKKAASEVVNVAHTTASQVQQATTKFDSAAFWARQGKAATDASKVTERESVRAAKTANLAWTVADLERIKSAEQTAAHEAQVITKRVATATRATSTVIKDARTGATLTQAELAKIIGGGSKVVEAEAAKVGKGVGSVLGSLQKLFLQNNFLFRQLGQRAAGDLGFAAVGVGKLALNFQQLAGQSITAAAGLEGVAGSAAGLLGVLGPVGIVVGAVVVGVTALAAASIASAAGMFYFAKSVSDSLEHFDDLSRQTGLSTDNLQALDIVTRQSGSTLDKLTNSVGQLQRKLIDASEGGTSRLSVGLKKLNIDLEDPNRALSQLIDLLIKLPAGTVRTGAAMQIFGRGGRDVAGVIDQIAENVGTADGALDRLKKQFIDSGIHIDKDGTQTAARFHDEWIKIEAQFQSVQRVIGEEALPTVLSAATKFSDWIARNRVEIGNWARDIEHVAEGVLNLATQLLKLAAIAALPMIIELKLVPKIAEGGGNFTTNLAVELGKRIGVPAQPSETFARRTFTQDAEAQQTADDAAKRIRDAFAQRKRGGGKGEDPAQTARRLAEIALQETIKGLEAEHSALQRQLDLNFIAREKYTTDAINLELKRRQAVLDGLKKELTEAERIRKPGQREVEVARIKARMLDLERESANKVRTITDDSAAEQVRIGQAAAQSQLRIIETQVDRIKARIRDYANFRVITERQAAEFEQQQTLRVFNARERILRQELLDAGKSAEKRAEAQNKLNELDEERRSFIEESSRRIEAAIRNDAENVIRFVSQIRDAFQRAIDVRMEAGEMNLEPLRSSILTRHELWDEELKLEVAREQQRHNAIRRNFEDEARLARIRAKAVGQSELELAATLRGIRAQAEAEEALHQARLRQLTTQAAEQRRQELLQVADDLASIASDIFDAIGKSSEEFWRSLKQSATNFAKQIRDELFKGFLEKLITGQARGAEGLIGAIINPLLGATGGNPQIADNTKATQANTAAINALTGALGGGPAVGGGLSGVLQLIPGLFGGARAGGGPVDAGRVYQIHDNEFFRPNISGKIYNLDQMSAALNSASGEVRTIVALGDDAVSEAMESHRLTPQGKRAAIVRGRWNRKTGGLQFA